MAKSILKLQLLLSKLKKTNTIRIQPEAKKKMMRTRKIYNKCLISKIAPIVDLKHPSIKLIGKQLQLQQVIELEEASMMRNIMISLIKELKVHLETSMALI